MTISRRVFAKNFRGFKLLDLDLTKVHFAMGDNSSGKSSILHLINTVLSSRLDGVPTLDEELSVSRHDYFSQYLDYKEVLFGYSETVEKKTTGRIITVKRRANADPVVTRASFFSDEMVVTIKRHGSDLHKRKQEIGEGTGVTELIGFHEAKTGFRVVRNKNANDSPPPNHFMALVESFEKDFLTEHRLLDTFFEKDPSSVRHLSPVRGLPEKYYDFKRTISVEGRHFAAMIQDIKADEGEAGILRRINEFGRGSGLFEKLEVKRVSKRRSDSPLVVSVSKQGKEFFLNQVGVGVSQVIPVLVECLVAESRDLQTTLLLQQPELHLHPVAQAEMGTFLFGLQSTNINPVIETHSRFLVDRYRSHLKEKTYGQEGGEKDAEIIFCENKPDGNHCTHIPIAPDGRLIDPPKAYFQFFLDEIERTMM